MTTNASSASLDSSSHDPASAEEAGAAAFRAGIPRDPVPSLCTCAGTGAASECSALVESWQRGWDRTQLLQEVTERMFPASALQPDAVGWRAGRGALPHGAAAS